MKNTPYYWNAKEERFSATKPALVETSFYSKNIIKIYFDIAYFLCVTPFKLTVVKNSFEPKTWKPQQACCILMHLLSLLHLALEFIIAIKDADASVQVYAFGVLGNGCFTAYISYSIFGFWRQKRIYVKLVEGYIRSSILLGRTRNWVKYPICAKIIIIIVTGITVFTGSLECLPNVFSSARSWVLCFSNETLPSLFSNSTDVHFANTNDILVASLFTTSQLARLLTYVMSDLSIFILILSMWTVVCDYDSYCEKAISHENVCNVVNTSSGIKTSIFQGITDALATVHTYAALINETLHYKLALYLIDASLYFPLDSKSIFLPGSYYFRLHFLIGFSSVCAILALAANVKTKIVSSSEKVVIEGYKINVQPQSDQLSLLQMLGNSISICCNNAVELSVGFLGNMYVLFITLFVISTTTT